MPVHVGTKLIIHVQANCMYIHVYLYTPYKWSCMRREDGVEEGGGKESGERHYPVFV